METQQTTIQQPLLEHNEYIELNSLTKQNTWTIKIVCHPGERVDDKMIDRLAYLHNQMLAKVGIEK